MAITTTTTTHVVSVVGEQAGSFGSIGDTFLLDIWEYETGELKVQLMKNGRKFANKTFRDCETQHSDSERWLNDKIGWPNPFAGILIARAWH